LYVSIWPGPRPRPRGPGLGLGLLLLASFNISAGRYRIQIHIAHTVTIQKVTTRHEVRHHSNFKASLHEISTCHSIYSQEKLARGLSPQSPIRYFYSFQVLCRVVVFTHPNPRLTVILTQALVLEFNIAIFITQRKKCHLISCISQCRNYTRMALIMYSIKVKNCPPPPVIFMHILRHRMCPRHASALCCCGSPVCIFPTPPEHRSPHAI